MIGVDRRQHDTRRCAGAVVAMMVTWITDGKPDVGMTGNGLLAGLVGDHRRMLRVRPDRRVSSSARSPVCIVVAGVALVDRIQIDDPVGAVAVHGVCGAFGVIAVGLFAAKDVDGRRQAGPVLGRERRPARQPADRRRGDRGVDDLEPPACCSSCSSAFARAARCRRPRSPKVWTPRARRCRATPAMSCPPDRRRAGSATSSRSRSSPAESSRPAAVRRGTAASTRLVE